MKRIMPPGDLKLAGFNNLTKCLSFNLYDFCVARTEEEKLAWRQYVLEKYSAEKITEYMKGICNIIEANVLAVSDQDYDPWGASSMVLMSDIKGPFGGQTAMHLDKSHICAHTYPDVMEKRGIGVFRIDIDIATCGEISPLRALDYMFESFDSDVVVIDYVVRGYTSDDRGHRVYMDHAMNSIQDFVDESHLKDYHCVDLALQSDNIWQTKMLRTTLNEDSYFLNKDILTTEDRQKMIDAIKREMRAVLYMWPE